MWKVKIEIQKITKRFKNVNVLNAIDVTFEAGHVYGIIGRNGSGKSVFLKILLGFVRPTTGNIKFFLNGNLFEPQIAAVLDGSSLYLGLSAKENLVYLSKFRGLIGKSEIEVVLRKVNLDPQNDVPIKKYSTGMKKRLLIAQAIMEPADVVVMDEPTNGLDEKGIELLYEIVAEMQRKGMIVLITSHSHEDIVSMCDVVYRMKEGKLWLEEME